MACFLRAHIDDNDFAERFTALQFMKREQSADVNDAVAAIIDDVRARGDAALIALTEKYDRQTLTAETLRISDAEIDAAMAACAPETKAALELAATRIADFHARQKPENARFTDAAGVELGHRWGAVDAAGLYVPGGLANYPSSVLMNAIPARVAGVARVVMVVPTPDGKLNPLVLVAAKLAGVDEIYRIGGAQAVAALAYGTQSIAPVNVIVGPGNAYVAAAKKQVFGQVGIDMIAGPSEILVVSDTQNDPAWMAADLLSQAEHDEVAQSILICDDADYADAVEQAVETALQTLSRGEIARKSWQNFGAILVVEDLTTQAPDLINQLAPEHLELAVEDPEAMAGEVRHAGAIFMGRYSAEALGDYCAGPSHVLPTSGTARFFSALGVYDFQKRSSLIYCSEQGASDLGKLASVLGRGESLTAHARSAEYRIKK